MRWVTRDDLSHAAHAAAAVAHLPGQRKRTLGTTERHPTALSGDTRPDVPRMRRSRREYRNTCKYQAMLTLLPASEDEEEQEALTWSAWRAVIRAEDHVTRRRQLLTVIVSGLDGDGPEGDGPSADPHVVVTMVVLGRSPADCLSVGDVFTLWRGRDVARGIITRRLFV